MCDGHVEVWTQPGCPEVDTRAQQQQTDTESTLVFIRQSSDVTSLPVGEAGPEPVGMTLHVLARTVHPPLVLRCPPTVQRCEAEGQGKSDLF